MSSYYNRDKCDDRQYMEDQWRAYMGAYTTLSLEEAYDVYTRPGCGGKKWNKTEKKMFDKILELTFNTTENPFIFRFCPEKPLPKIESKK